MSANALIEQNRFRNTLGEAVRAVYAPNIRLQQNRVDSCARGFLVNFCSTAVVQYNRIYTTSYSCMTMYDCRGTAANRVLVANNMLANVGNSTQTSGALIQSCRYLDFSHNSLNIQSGPEQCFGVRLANSCRYIRMQNNSVVVLPGGIPVMTENEQNEVETFSHCNLYNGLILTDLPPNSFSANPYYNSPTDLHVSNSVLDNKGTPLPAVTKDVDGENRSATTPDIGADEYTPVPVSAAVGGFVNPSADSVYCAELPLEAVLQNTGSSALTSAVLTVTLNGVAQTPVPWSGNLASGQTATVSLGFPALVPLQSNTVSVQVSMPNGVNDQFTGDDELVFGDLFSGLSGTYTIGGNNPDFPTFSAAVNALQKGGLCGNTTMLVRNGTYNEQIQIWGLKGSSAQKQLTFLGESGDSSAVVLGAPSSVNNAFTLRMQNCKFVAFKKLTISQLAANNNTSAVFVAFGSDITFENCILRGYYGFNGVQNSDMAFAAFPDSNLTVRNCLIGGAGMGANLVGVGPLKYNLIFENNTVSGADDDCLNLQQWRNVRVRNNRFVTASGSSLYGIYGLNLYNYDISNNRVSIGGVQATVGIYLINCSEYNDDISLVSNNAISMNLSESFVAVSRGMWIINCDSIRILHNTIRHNSTDLDNYAIEIQQTAGATVLNNVFVNTGLGFAFRSNGNTNTRVDHNVYFSNGAWLSPGASDLAGLQTQTGDDQHSVVANPMWTNGAPDSLLLHNSVLENIGTQTEVLTDQRGFPRQLPNPDPGAFETPSAPVVHLGGDTAVCGALTLHGFTPGASSYLWNTGATTADLQVDFTGTYILTVMNDIGSSADTIEVEVFPIPEAHAGQDISICYGDTMFIQAQCSNFSNTCAWSDLNGNPVGLGGPAFLLSAENSTVYILTAVSDFNCSASDTLFVQVYPNPQQPVIVQNGNVLSVNATDAVQWQLNGLNIEGATGNSFIPTETGWYSVTATNIYGCSAPSELYFYMFSATGNVPENGLAVFPNPVAGASLFVRASGNFTPGSFAIFDARGRLLNSSSIELQTADTYTIPAPVESGMYFLKISDASGKVFVKKVEVY